MDEPMITTFASPRELEAALCALRRMGLPHEVLLPPAGLDWLAAPGLIVSVATRAALMGEVGDAVRFSGWVEYRPPAVAELPGPQAPPDGDVFGNAAIEVLSQCVADERKIRIIASLDGDLEPVFPYLNTVMTRASYSPRAQTFSYLDGARMVVLQPRRIAMAKPDELVDAWLRLAEIRRIANDVWSRRQEIPPSYTTRVKPPALEILKRLPRTNCGRCGEMTCMAFALRLWVGEARLEACEPVLSPKQAPHLAALREICAGLAG